VSRFEIVPLGDDDRAWLRAVLTRHWGSPRVVSRGRLHQADRLPGLVARRGDERVGVLLHRLDDRELEIVVLQALVRRQGVGGSLLDAVRSWATERGVRRLWLITTNDNRDAIAFYRRYGFEHVTTHRGAVRAARRLKPEIPEYGDGGVPIEDELEFEIRIGTERQAGSRH
jgi:GNAT superfamily N-acetyltransferase